MEWMNNVKYQNIVNIVNCGYLGGVTNYVLHFWKTIEVVYCYVYTKNWCCFFLKKKKNIALQFFKSYTWVLLFRSSASPQVSIKYLFNY